MTAAAVPDVLAIDLGSSRVKLGWRRCGGCAAAPANSALPLTAAPLAFPDDTLCVEHVDRDPDVWLGEIEGWLDDTNADAPTQCLIGSVQPRAGMALVERLRRRSWARLTLLAAHDLPLEIRTSRPERVGIDRLLDAVAVNRLRAHGAAAIVVSMGTAVTVNLIAPDGAFQGGAIFAGPRLSLGALHRGTASLPKIAIDRAAAPPPVGKSTAEALWSGAYWAAAGAVNELVRRMAEGHATPELYLTGGAAEDFAPVLNLAGRPLRHIPHLTLAGIFVVAERLPSP